MQLLPFQQKHSKSRSFFSGLQASEPAAPIANRCATEREAMKFAKFPVGVMPATNLG